LVTVEFVVCHQPPALQFRDADVLQLVHNSVEPVHWQIGLAKQITNLAAIKPLMAEEAIVHWASFPG
jgi:hypothetical protein